MRHWIHVSLLSACSVLLAPVPSFSQDPAQNRPVPISYDEVEKHRTGDRAFIRVTTSDRASGIRIFEGIGLHVTVDADGHVISATAEKDVSPDLRSRAESAAKTLQFKPFERNGHAVVASFEDRIAVLPPELTPTKRMPFPEIHNWNSIRMTLERSTCFGTCPSYRVEVHGDGTVLYEGRGYVAVTGSHRASIPKQTVAELLDGFRYADYYSLQDEYVLPATDLPTYETSIQIDGKLKKVKDYAGEQIGMPLSVSRLENEIDRLVDTERWIKGNEKTVQSLVEEKWDFKSPQATETLSRVAQSGSPGVVSELLDVGVPVDPNSKATVMALSQAAAKGDVSMLQALLTAGANKSTIALNRALFAAASMGHLEAFRLLTVNGATSSDNPRGRTLLMAAAGSGVPGVVQEVLSSTTDVNTRDAQGHTALIDAVEQQYLETERPEVNRAEVVRILLERGADPNVRDDRGNTALIECARNAEAALALIKHGANLNTQNKDGLTALINAVNPDVARVLIENGADLYLRDKDGKTALDEAKAFNRPEKAAVLTAARRQK